MKKPLIGCIAALFVFASNVDAHSGRTDKSGCHKQRGKGTHCHGKKVRKSSYQQSPKTSSASHNLSKAEVREIQMRLISLGYKPGPADGVFGGKTKRAIQRFQNDRAISVNGIPSGYLLLLLRQLG